MGHYLAFLLISLSLLFTGCTKNSLCDAGKTAGGLISAQVAVSFDCKGVDAIRSDIEAKLVSLKVCEAPAPAPVPPSGVEIKSAVGSLVCKAVIDGLAAGLLKSVPSKWECSGGPLTEEVKTKLLEACSKAL